MTQLPPCSENCSILSRDTMEHPPFVRYAKSARPPEIGGRLDKTSIPGRSKSSLSHGGAYRHLVSAPWRIAAIQKADGAPRWGTTAASRSEGTSIRGRSHWPSCDAPLSPTLLYINYYLQLASRIANLSLKRIARAPARNPIRRILRILQL